MKVYGLTGGIASGKSTVGKLFHSFGVPVIDGDQLSRKVVEPGKPAYFDLRERWPQCFDSGILIRKALADLVFPDPLLTAELNRIVLPRIDEALQQYLQGYEAFGTELVLYESALLTDPSSLSGLIAVRTSPELQRTRLMARNNLTEQEAQVRMNLQKNFDWSRATHVIENTGSLPLLEEQVTVLYSQISGNPVPFISGVL